MFSYKWDKEIYVFKLYYINNLGRQILIGEFADREDILIYLEENYNATTLIIKGEKDE